MFTSMHRSQICHQHTVLVGFYGGFVYGVVKHYVQQAVYEYLEEKYGDELNPVLKQGPFSVISSIATEFT